MEATVKVQTVLIMSESEADWLKNIMQNPIHENENNKDREMRETFWNAIHAATHIDTTMSDV